MTTSLRISEVAERAGITTATVRYYERVGVLPTADRSANGYRSYDQRTVERLGFIGRAKQLGCTLEEIGDLVTAWDGGQCGPVQDQLRRLVADKLAATQTEITALATLSDELRRAAATLDAHRPDGPCDDRCGCQNDPIGAQPISLTTKTDTTMHDEPVVACSLSADRARDRIEEWHRLFAGRTGVAGTVTSRHPIDRGVRLEFDDSIDVAALVGLATAEHDCCRFFSFALTIDHRGIGLDISAPPDAHALLTTLFGANQ